MPGGPRDGSVIPSYGGHIARLIWNGEERWLLKCQNRDRACDQLQSWFASFSPQMVAAVEDTGLSHLPQCMFAHLDVPLICAFVERWQPDTNTFHFPFGEMTIMLHDVWHILRIPVEGRTVSTQASSEALRMQAMQLLGVDKTELLAPPTPHWGGGGILIDSIVDIFSQRSPDTQLQGYMLLLFGSTLFVDKSGNRVRPADILELVEGLEHISSYAWGAATLANLYRQLGIASRGTCSGIAGCLTLLQAWIYEHFPPFRPHRERLVCAPHGARASTWSTKKEGISTARLTSFRQRLDDLDPSMVVWLPYGPDLATTVPRTIFTGWLCYRDVVEPYMPDCVLRQLGYVQTIPMPISHPNFAYRPADSKLYEVDWSVATADYAWTLFPRGFRLILCEYERASDPTATAPDYGEWFTHASHMYVVPDGAAVYPAIPDRTLPTYWMGRMLTAIKGWMDARHIILPEHTRSCADAVDEVIRDWNDFSS